MSPLDVVAAAFGRVLRRQGVAASPAEVIEVRRVLTMLGAADLDALRSGLRAVTVKYDHERPGFERSFTAFFSATEMAAATAGGGRGLLEPGAEGLPTELELGEDDDPLGRYADYNPRAAEVGDLVDAPEKDQGFNPHRDDDDLSLAGADSELSVSSGEDQGRRGISYTVDLDRAGSAVAKELTSGRSAPVAGSIDLDDPAAILAWLAAYDPHAIYADGPGGDQLSATQLDRLVEAITDFVEALAERAGLGRVDDPDATGDGDHADVRFACHELLRRMRGAPRRVPREHSRGPLDVRHTVRASMRTDGVPFHLVVRRSTPDRIRLLVVADVSLSVRSITAFALRLAQTLHGMAFRCRVLAYVDTPVDVTDVLLRSRGDGALAAVLAAPGLDLDATSDYGRVLAAMNAEHAGLVDKRTAVLFVGDGRCNGLPDGAEDLRRLTRRAHRVGWITPEPRRYWTQASCAMPTYAEIVDHVTIARDPAELAGQVGELGHALS
ncbi:MadC family VWA domain-containing protein [Pseudonocardia abyssalis]|uniref:VWA domain-containing protein n=1 Tax=Pseudonocardia abyssalis TaxID=2792008 RepID=A0ABS6V1F9_9PSEU|nr:VWA domain-containing protein [Pseudonocardia abyssalis]MBW0115310.1 VWA domain-containing protein [Pseudonocardia abyssalis]MBW0137804.1 VWA domain-containing protein [Pseudonocardia abyssalis]